MPTDTPTARELFEQSNHFRDEGGPGMPKNLENCPTPRGGAWFSCCGSNEFQVDDAHAAAILRDHGHTFLVNKMFAPQTWQDVSGSYVIRLGGMAPKNIVDITRKTLLECYNAAIGAVLDAKEGK